MVTNKLSTKKFLVFGFSAQPGNVVVHRGNLYKAKAMKGYAAL